MSIYQTHIVCTQLVLFFFNDTATTEIYTLSLHDALPISPLAEHGASPGGRVSEGAGGTLPATSRAAHREADRGDQEDRKSTRLNSSHGYISYAVFCLKKKKTEHSN